MIDWKQRGAKILGSFFTGYGAGWSAMLPGNLVMHPEEILWFWLFILPALSGLANTWPQLAKTLNEFAMGK